MKRRFILFLRGSTFYVEDTVSKKQTSLFTKDRATAERSSVGPFLSFAISSMTNCQERVAICGSLAARYARAICRSLAFQGVVKRGPAFHVVR